MAKSNSYRSSAALRARCGELRLDVPACPVACASVVTSSVMGQAVARRAAVRSRAALVGHFPSFKMNMMFPTESFSETNIMMLADVDENVRVFRPQALRVFYEHCGRTVTAYPDIALIRADGCPELWECKPNGRVCSEVYGRLRNLRAALLAVGIRYVVRQPSRVLQAPRGRNVALIWRHADRCLPDGLAFEAADVLRTGVSTLGTLGRRTGASFPMLFALAARGSIAVDIGLADLGEGSLVRMPVPGATSGAFDATDAASGSPWNIIRPT